ncbi:hypothetical protein GCM10027054_29950 [Isoptericola nanjingensis]
MAPRTRIAETSRSRLVTLGTAADELSVSVKTLRRRIADGTVTGYRIGRLIRVDIDELRERLVVAVRTGRRAG